jgi:hypothetical protein
MVTHFIEGGDNPISTAPKTPASGAAGTQSAPSKPDPAS